MVQFGVITKVFDYYGESNATHVIGRLSKDKFDRPTVICDEVSTDFEKLKECMDDNTAVRVRIPNFHVGDVLVFCGEEGDLLSGVRPHKWSSCFEIEYANTPAELEVLLRRIKAKRDKRYEEKYLADREEGDGLAQHIKRDHEDNRIRLAYAEMEAERERRERERLWREREKFLSLPGVYP